MKIIYSIFCFLLISSIAHAQIDYSYFKQTWSKCMPDSGAIATDTLIFRIKSEACKTKKYTETHVYTEELIYTFEKKNSVDVYTSSGSAPREDYVGEKTIKVFYKINSVGDTVGVDSMYYKIQRGPALSGCTLSYSMYELDKSKNRLIVFKVKGKDEYEILFLSSKMLVMRKIQ
ncbi:hypothetical protein [Cytophaga aurantiaca]|uniref:hypothetical protein n=1 Tax=Cytophaga aurantiaca TaxID=29530 RepID=UPI000377B56F|nr:hypothetical protein [Cytophaga aurantiaca]